MAGSGGSTRQDPHAARIAVLGSGQDEQVRALQDVARVSDLRLQAQPLARALTGDDSMMCCRRFSQRGWRVDSCQRWEALGGCHATGVECGKKVCIFLMGWIIQAGSASGEQRIFC